MVPADTDLHAVIKAKLLKDPHKRYIIYQVKMESQCACACLCLFVCVCMHVFMCECIVLPIVCMIR